VLAGVFQDEHGDYPAGTYVRNPPTTSHTPGAAQGCTIFVKLWQFDADDRTQFRKDMAAELTSTGEGVKSTVLHQDARETVRFISLDAGQFWQETPKGGSEVLMINGTATEGADTLVQNSWLRLPEGADLHLTAGPEGAQFWVKTGHLPFAAAPMV
jgi:anti-sigma factor ChrR (cupin superfamily)